MKEEGFKILMSEKSMKEYIYKVLEKDQENKSEAIGIFYDHLMPEFMKQVRNMLSCYGRTIEISREKNYLKRLISAEITHVYNNVVQDNKEEK